MSSIYSSAASVNACDQINDVFWGHRINQRAKRTHGMWIHGEIFLLEETRYCQRTGVPRVVKIFFLIVWLNVEVQQLLGCDKKMGLMKFSASKHSTGYMVVLECLTYMPAEPAWHCFVQKSPVMVPWDRGIRKRIRIIFPGRRFKVCYSYSRSIPKRLPRSVYLKTAAN